MAKDFGCRPSDLLNGDAEDFKVDQAAWIEGKERERKQNDQQAEYIKAMRR